MAALVVVVDDDISVRESLESLIRSVGLEVKVFASAEDYLNTFHSRKADCLILDVRLPGITGIELHKRLMARRCEAPAIFITAHGYDDRAKAEVRSEWTVACLTKPFSEDELLDAVNSASNWKPKLATT